MRSLLVIVCVILGFGAPWTWWLQRRSADSTLEGLLDRISLGYASSFVGLFVASQLRLWLFLPIWCGGVVACLVGEARRSERPRLRLELGREGKTLLGSAALYLALRCLPILQGKPPSGWDAYFHMTIAEAIVAHGRAVHDWLPYEDMPLNYPIGSHLLLALTQWLSGARPHQFFELLVVWFTLLSGLQIFALATRATRDRGVGCYAALAYLFLANLGSLDYTRWSGLPNLIGMYVFLGLLSSLVRDSATHKRSVAVFATFFLAACFVHHHVMVTAGLCLIWTAAWLYFAGERASAKHILLGLTASGVIGSAYFLMYLLRSTNLGQTGIGGYVEPAADAWGLAQTIGLGFCIPVAAGVYRYFAHDQPVSPLVTQPLVAMLGLYIAVEFVFRTAASVWLHRELAPFTPSRFITSAVTLGSVFAGLFFRAMQGSRAANRAPIVALILTGFFVWNRSAYRSTFDRSLSAGRLAAYAWIRTHTDADTALLDSRYQTSYFTRRMSSSFPLPTSEYEALALQRSRLRLVQAGAPPEPLQRRVLAIVEREEVVPAGKPVWHDDSGLRIVERLASPRAREGDGSE